MCITFGQKIPWGGDEWFSYNNFTIMGLPFSILTKIMKSFIGEVTLDNYLIYRQQGLVWSTLLYIIFTAILIRSDNQQINGYIIFYLLFISINPYVIQTIEFFRYYGLYFFSTSILTLFFLFNHDRYIEKRYLFLILTVFSLFIHLFLFIQFAVYVLLKEIIYLNRKFYFITISFTLFILVIPYLPEILSYLYNSLFPIYYYDYSLIHRGLSLSTFIKPIMTIYTFLFGSSHTPLSSHLIDVLFIVYGIMIIFGVYKLTSKHRFKHPIFLAGMIPFFISIFVIEPLSLPAMTQIAPQHVLFLFPWVIFIFYYVLIKSESRFTIGAFLCFGTIYASYSHQNMNFVDYSKIVKKLPSHQIPIISDAPKQFKFFIESNDMVWFRDKQKLVSTINNNEIIGLMIGNWKLYEKLDSLQFWHNPMGTATEFNSLNQLLDSLRIKGFSLFDSYSFFPVQFYLFKKGKSYTNSIPWFYDIKYKDLKLPININGDKVIGFEKIFIGEKRYINSEFYYFIQSTYPGEKKNVIEITHDNGIVESYGLENDNDKYRSFFSRAIKGDSIGYIYNKLPLISNSMKHPGSISKTEARIYHHIHSEKGFHIEIKDEDIVIVKAIVSDNI